MRRPILAATLLLLAAAAARAQADAASLLAAAREGKADRVAQLLAQGEKVDGADGSGATPLIEASMHGQLDVVKLLLDRGAKVDLAGENGPALAEAVYANHFDVASLLLERGADINARNAQGSTALIFAAYPGEVDAVRFLLEHGADASAQDNRGRTALTMAAEGEALLYRQLQPLRVRGLWGWRPVGPQVNRKKLDDYREIESLLRGGAPDGGSAAAAPAASVASRPAGPPPGPAMSKKELAAIVKEAAEQGAKEAAKKPPPEVFDSDVDMPAYLKAERPHDFALVVGVEKYANDLPQASFAARDAAAVREHLVALGFPARNIKLLENDRASRGSLEAYLEEWLPRNVKSDSRVFFYFAGHGAPDPKSSQAYLVLSDGDPNFLAHTGFPLKKLYADLSALKAKQVLVALDSCFSGAGGRSVLAEGARPLVTRIDAEMPASGKITVFAAASSKEITGTLKEQGHGLFTYYLLKGLSDAAKDENGAVTPRALYDYLKPKVQDAASRQNHDQTPVFESDEASQSVPFD